MSRRTRSGKGNTAYYCAGCEKEFGPTRALRVKGYASLHTLHEQKIHTREEAVAAGMKVYTLACPIHRNYDVPSS